MGGEMDGVGLSFFILKYNYFNIVFCDVFKKKDLLY